MTTLHNETVTVGDTVFDTSVTRGLGKVFNVLNDSIEVHFESGNRATYNTNGVQRGKSRVSLFWHDPVFLVPMKSEKYWALQREISKSMYLTLKNAEVKKAIGE